MIRAAIYVSVLIGLIVCGTSPSGEALAQEWTFEQIAQEAGATHPFILSKRQSQDSALADVESAKWQRFPTPSIEASRDSGSTNNLLFSLQQPLWTGGKITSTIEGAESRYGASRESVQEAWRDVISRVIDAYVEAVRRKAHQSIQYRNVQQHERLLGMITRRVEQEASPQVDKDLAQSRLYQAVNDLSSVTQALTNALTRLSELTGKTVAKVAPLDDLESGLPESKAAAIDYAIAKSPTLASLGFQKNAAEADIKFRKASYWPVVAVRLEDREGQYSDLGTGRFSDQRAMLVLESQVGAGFSAYSNVKSAVAKKDAVEMQRQDAIKDLKITVSEAWDELVAARIRLKNSNLSRQSAATVFESYTRQYTIGHKSWLDVLNSIRESTQAEILAEDSSAEVVRTVQRLRLLTDNLNLPKVSYAK